MTQALSKKTLVHLARAIRDGDRIDTAQVRPFLDHRFREYSTFARFMLKVAAALSLFFASVLVIFPEVGEFLIGVLPGFFLLPERLAKAFDYVWGLVGKPVGKQHLMYHLPNIIIYAFGVAGVRQLWRRIHRDNWKDLVASSQEKLERMIDGGTARFTFPKGFSMLFVGHGDEVARSLVADDPLIGPTLSTTRPTHTDLWARFRSGDGDEGFERVLKQFNAGEAGEYVLFPVVDTQLFLPGLHEYDIPPHRVEISVSRIRAYEAEHGWARKPIVLVGDKEQRSTFVTTTRGGLIETENADVSLQTIAAAYADVVVADPTDITLARIIEIADGRQLHFRASDRGAEKYSARFYHRLSLTGYEPTRDAVLTVGYDITDLETEHQVVSHRHSDYLPVILSRDVYDLLSRSYLRDCSHIFVPRLVKEKLQELVA